MSDSEWDSQKLDANLVNVKRVTVLSFLTQHLQPMIHIGVPIWPLVQARCTKYDQQVSTHKALRW